MKLLIKRLLAYLPTKLPVGMAEFNTWADSIFELSGRFADDTSMRFALASMVIHADIRHGTLPKKYFVDRLRKSAANQVASQVFQDIKEEQQKATQTKNVTPSAEDTAAQESTASNGKEAAQS